MAIRGPDCSTLIVWDMDNIMPPSEYALLQTLLELQVDSNCKVVLAANERTMDTLSMDTASVVAQIEHEMPGVAVDWCVVRRRKNAVDMILRDAMVRFAREISTGKKERTCYCISNDGDFCGVLAYIRYLGIHVVTVGTMKHSEQMRMKVRNASLAEVANASVVIVYTEDGTTKLHEQI